MDILNFGSHCTGTLIASNINNKNERDKSITIKKSVCKKSKKKPGQTFVDSNSHFSEQKEILKKKMTLDKSSLQSLRSESPTQAYLILVIWLYRKFKALQDIGKSSADLTKAVSSVTLAYDNMCHVDSLKISKKELPFPAPLNKAWSNIGKVIDRLHLRNHKDSRCKRLYNPDNKIPAQFNTMAGEQTFVWASRLKKIVCAMTRLHQFFFLHRAVKRRNRYTELCYSKGKVPVLPKVKAY